ncbi:CPSF A subunit region-domain-containing protein [Cunninghamella echinulata]|nr:CPSF A subunit region-domain-containing protein [Cunninghamella echinulata]
MSAYTIYKELFPPQTVEHVEQAHFTSPVAINLIVAKGSLVQIYNFIEYEPETQGSPLQNDEIDDALKTNNIDTFPVGDNDDDNRLSYPVLTPLDDDIAGTHSARLELVAQYSLNGTIATMGVVRTSSPRGKEGCDSLLLGFEDAKMSLLEWSPATNSIVTVSIHYYERDELKKEFLSNTYTPSLRIDPQQRCAVLNFYNDKLAVLPFRQEDQLDMSGQDYDEDDPNIKRPYISSFIIDIPTIDKRVKNVVDIVFLSDYYEPTLAILYQSKQTWTGQTDEDKDVCSIMVISLDLSEKVYPVIYSLDKLPSDSLQLVAMPKPIHGILVISSNALLHVSQGSPGVGVAVNGYTKSTTSFSGMKYDPSIIELGLLLDGARALYLSGGVCLLFLQNGDWITVTFIRDGNKIVKLQVNLLPFSQTKMIKDDNKNKRIPNQYTPVALVPTCVCNVKSGQYFFLGSRVGNSLLIKWKKSFGEYKKQSSDHGFIFRVCDELLNTGPIVDMAIGDMEIEKPVTTETESSTSTTPSLSTLPDMELVSCSGYGKNGALSIFRRHIRPESTFSFDQTDCQAVWSIKTRKEQYYKGIKVSGNTSHQNTIDFSESDADMDGYFDKLLFISKSNSTMVLAAGDELQELEKSGFYTKGSTVLVSTLFNHTRIVQIHEKGLYLLTPDGKRLQSIPVKQSRVIEASVHNPYIILVLESKTIMALQCDESSKDLIYVPVPPSLNKSKNVYSASIFADTTGLFGMVKDKRAKLAAMKQQYSSIDKKRKANDYELLIKSNKKQHTTTTNSTITENENSTDFDEIDMDLYGDLDGDNDGSDSKIKKSGATSPSINNTNKENGQNNKDSNEDEDDEEDSLYGDSTSNQQKDEFLISSSMTQMDTINETNVSIMGGMKEISQIVSLWCLIYTDNGTMGLYSLPDFQEHFYFPKLDLLQNLITDYPIRNSDVTHDNSTFMQPLFSSRQNDLQGVVKIKEVLLTNIGKEHKDPHLVLRTSTSDVVIYKAFEYLPTPENTNIIDVEVCTEAKMEDYDNRLALRFSRVHHNYVARFRSDEESKKEQELEELAQKEKEEQEKMVIDLGDDDDIMMDNSDNNTKKKKKKQTIKKPRRRQLLNQFTDVNGYAGVFVAGPEPLWLISSSKSFVRVHPMKTDQSVLAFSQFHNINCLHGFITIDTNSKIQLCTLPIDDTTYDMDWLLKKVPLGQTVHKIRYHPTMHVYVVLVSTPMEADLENITAEATTATANPGAATDTSTPTTENNNETNEEDNEAEKEVASVIESELTQSKKEREPGAFLPLVDRYSLLMISPVTWETVDQITFSEYEQGLSLECVSLESKQTSTGRKHFIVIGTGVLRGEDTAMKGSVYVYEIIEVVPEIDNPQTNHKFKHLHKEDVKGAVTASCDVSGHLAACIGSKVIVYSFEDNESLVGVAFIDVNIYITCMCSIKNFILLGDVQKSIWFLGFQLEPSKLVMLGKDYQSFEVASVNYIIDDKSLYLMVGDTDNNLDIYQYAPYNLQSISGQKLMRRGDFHIGSQVHSMIRLPQIVINSDKKYEYSRRHFCLCGSFNGSISVVSPIPEKTFKRLNTLYSQLVNSIQHVAGLNPRAYRLIKGSKQRMASNRTKAVLDGDIIHNFAGLAVDRQRDLTKQIGTTVPRIMEDIVEIMGIHIDHF